MRKQTKENWHYLILLIFIVSAVFLTYFLSTLTPFMDWINGSSIFLKVFSWISLFFMYFIIIGLIFIPLDKFLHYVFKLG